MLGQIEEPSRSAPPPKRSCAASWPTPHTSCARRSPVHPRLLGGLLARQRRPRRPGLAMRRIQEEGSAWRHGRGAPLLARLGEGRDPDKLPVDIARVVGDCVSDARAAGPGPAITVDRWRRRPCSATTSSSTRWSATSLSNAVRHTPPEAAIRVTLNAADGLATLAVADDGPGLMPTSRPRCSSPSSAPTSHAPARPAAPAWASPSSPPSSRRTTAPSARHRPRRGRRLHGHLPLRAPAPV